MTSSSEPDVRSIERFDLYDAAANQHALARFRAMQMKIVANLRREEDLTSESAVTLRRYIGFLYTTLDVLGPAWFSCKADEGVQDRLITGFEENAELFSAGKLSFEQASRNVRRLLAPVQKHLSISA